MIENEFYNDEFEHLLKEKADQFSMYPSKRVWYSIYNNLHPSRRWPSVVISLFLITSLMLIGYLNTGNNSITSHINSRALNEASLEKINNNQITDNKKQNPSVSAIPQKAVTDYTSAFSDMITNETDFYPYTVVRSNRPSYMIPTPEPMDTKITADKPLTADNGDLIQVVDTYIKSNKIFADVATVNKKNKPAVSKSSTAGKDELYIHDGLPNGINTTAAGKELALNPATNTEDKKDEKAALVNNTTAEKNALNEQKAWMENFASENKKPHNKSKGRLAYQVYITPAVNYRKLSTNSNGSRSPLANSDINSSIKQKPGFGFEAGVGLSYSLAKKLRFNTGVQFNYTNYNIHADETNHPILTTVLLNDPNTGYSFIAPRTTTTSNSYNAAALQPVTLHNRTYQLSVPLGVAYKISSKDNVDWFAGVSVQPTYVFGGKANIISSDLKSYVSEPSSIRTWNLNLGFETHMNFKLGSYDLQVGPQVRYQVNSTYKKSVALVEKPYAIGLRFGLTKGF